MEELLDQESLAVKTVTQLKLLLREHDVPFPPRARKGELVELHLRHRPPDNNRTYSQEQLLLFSRPLLQQLLRRKGIPFPEAAEAPQLRQIYTFTIRHRRQEQQRLSVAAMLTEHPHPLLPQTLRPFTLRKVYNLKKDSTQEGLLQTPEQVAIWLQEAVASVGSVDLMLHLLGAPDFFLEMVLGCLNLTTGDDSCDLMQLTREERLTLCLWSLHIGAKVTADAGGRRLCSQHSFTALPHVWGLKYQMPDRCSLLYAAFTGVMPPLLKLKAPERYKKLLSLSPTRAQQLWSCLYAERVKIDRVSGFYRLMANAEPHPMEPFILALEAHSLEQVAAAAGMLLPSNSAAAKERYFLANLKEYAPILTRTVKGAPPRAEASFPLLRQYTDQELKMFYNLSDPLFERLSREGRHRLIERLETRINTLKWHIVEKAESDYKTGRQGNPDLHIVELAPRTATLENPLLLLGTLAAYREWNLDELVPCFREYEAGWCFRVPDSLEREEFPREQMEQLQQLLYRRVEQRPERVQQLFGLMETIRVGLAHMREVKGQFERLVLLYKGGKFQSGVQSCLVELFLLGMRMRYWRGPKHPLPHSWIGLRGNKEKIFATPEFRERSVAEGLLQLRLQWSGSGSEIKSWLQQLPRIDYNFRTGRVSFGLERVWLILERMAAGRFCISQGGDILVQTGFYALKGLGVELKQFNSLIKAEFSPELFQYSDHVDLELPLENGI